MSNCCHRGFPRPLLPSHSAEQAGSGGEALVRAVTQEPRPLPLPALLSPRARGPPLDPLHLASRAERERGGDKEGRVGGQAWEWPSFLPPVFGPGFHHTVPLNHGRAGGHHVPVCPGESDMELDTWHCLRSTTLNTKLGVLWGFLESGSMAPIKSSKRGQCLHTLESCHPRGKNKENTKSQPLTKLPWPGAGVRMSASWSLGWVPGSSCSDASGTTFSD